MSSMNHDRREYMDISSRENVEVPFTISKPSKKTHSFVTFFDSGYLSRGLALIESMREQGDSSSVLVVCIDEKTYKLLELKADELNLECTTIESLIGTYPDLVTAKGNRSAVEFYFTLTPFLLRYALIGKPQNHIVVYLDADLYFFSSPLSVISTLETFSVALIEHNYPWFLRLLEAKYGTYNVGLLAFKHDEDGIRVLDWWSARCIEWCQDYPENGKYADQGYLNHFSLLTEKIQILNNPGFNLAPWNSASSKLRVDASKVKVNNYNLTFFHFHGLKHVGRWWISSQLNYYSPMTRRIFLAIYGGYVQHLKTIESQYDINPSSATLVKRQGVGFRGILTNTARTVFRLLSIVTGQAIRDKYINIKEREV